MTNETKPTLDSTDRRILAELQADARLSHVALGRRVHLSPPAVARRIERLERLGVITGYRAVVDVGRAGGQTLDAILRFRSHSGRAGEALRTLGEMPQVRECLRVTGEDCYVARLTLGTVAELAEVTDRLHEYGLTETSLVLATPIEWRPHAVAP